MLVRKWLREEKDISETVAFLIADSTVHVLLLISVITFVIVPNLIKQLKVYVHKVLYHCDLYSQYTSYACYYNMCY